MRILITGGCGFIGSNLASAVLKQKNELAIIDNLSRYGSEKNLHWLQSQGDFQFFNSSIENAADTERLIRGFKPDVIFHLAGQVAMTTSIENPRKDFEVNVVGTLNILETLRHYSSHTILTYSSTNKVYGDLEHFNYHEEPTRYTILNQPEGFDETTPLCFSTPYGCSKGAADQYMLDYAKIYGLKTIVFRHSSVFGDRQFSTFDQGWMGWFMQKAIETQSNPNTRFTISGDGKQVRDVLFVSDLVECYFKAVQAIDRTAGQAFNIGGSSINSISLLELFSILESELNIRMNPEKTPWRQSDQKIFIADVRKAKKYFDWKPTLDKKTGIQRMLQWMTQ